MAMTSGNKPTNGDSQLSGMSEIIYNNFYPVFVQPSIDSIDTMVRKKTITKAKGEKQKKDIIFKMKTLCWGISKGVIDHIVAESEVDFNSRDGTEIYIKKSNNLDTKAHTGTETDGSGNTVVLEGAYVKNGTENIGIK